MNYPPTSNILDALKEYLVKIINPADLGIDVYDGLKQKEAMLKIITQDVLVADMGIEEYTELEALLTSTIGKDGMVSILTGDFVPAGNYTNISGPTLSFYITEEGGSSSSSSSIDSTSTIFQDKYYPYFIVAAGGDIPLSSFDHTLVVQSSPDGSVVDVMEDSIQREDAFFEVHGRIRFSLPGTYSIQVTLQHRTQEAYMFVTRLIVNVE